MRSRSSRRVGRDLSNAIRFLQRQRLLGYRFSPDLGKRVGQELIQRPGAQIALFLASHGDGSVRFEIANRSHTRLEMPIVADVDSDGNAEIVFVEKFKAA